MNYGRGWQASSPPATTTETAHGSQALGQAVGSARQAAGFTQQELCQRTGISYSTLAKIERGAIKSPSIFTVATIAQATSTTVEALLANVQAPKPATKNYKTSDSGVRFVFFDVHGVLVCFYQRAFTKLARDTGLSEVKVSSSFWRYNDAICRGEITIQEFNQLIARQLSLRELDWFSYYLDAVAPIKEAQECLEQVARSYGVGLLTNIMPGLVDLLISHNKLPNLKYDAILDSSATGHIKPEPEFYQAAMTRAGVPANQILFIDDSPTNLMAAEKLGWQVLHFDLCSTDHSIDAINRALV